MSKLEYNAATPLYTSDAHPWRIDQLPAALAQIEQAGQPLVLFVHGRGKEPNKSLKGGTFTKGMAVHKVELGYGAKVLMFNWDSAFKGLNLFDREVPLSHTSAGGAALGQVLAALAQYRAAKPSAPKMALLVHSMGSIVVQKAVQENHWPATKGLFSSVLFSQPDADDVGHDSWLNHLAEQERVYVTFNQDDHVLQRSTDGRPSGRHALGLGTGAPLASSATYVDLSRMGALGKKDDDHEVFGKGAMNGQLYVCQFFEQVLTGRPVVLDPASNVETIERKVVYRLKSRHEPGAPCLSHPDLPST